MGVLKSNNAGVGCMILFATPFAGVGVFMVFLLIWSVYDCTRMQSWVETPATILDVGMEHGDGTEQVVAEYEYVYEGQKHVGSRVAINEMSDNLGTFQSRKYKELKSYKDQKKPFRCFVNPDEPEQSILYPMLRWELLGIFTLFGLVFGGAGFGIMGAAVFAGFKMKDESARAFEHPEEPWLWRPDWASGYADADTRVTTFLLIGFSLFWNLIAWPVTLFAIPQAIAEGDFWVLLLVIFPTIGIGLLVAAVINVIRWQKFGQTRFQMASTPGVIGGSLAGAVVARNLDSTNEFTQTLTCNRNSKDSDGDQTQEAIWQTSRVVSGKMPTGDADTAAIPVLFHIPYDCRPTTMDDDAVPSFSWQLEVKGKSAGVDFHSTFDVPVFKTAASSPDYKPDDSLISNYAKEDMPDTVFARVGVGRRVVGGQVHIQFGYGRNVYGAIALMIFILIWTGSIWLMTSAGAPILFAIVFGVIDLVLFYALIDMLLWTSEFEVDAQGLRGRFGILRKQSSFGIDDIQGIHLHKGMQSGNALYYHLQLKLRGRKKFTLGKSIKGYADADYIARDIQAALKLAGAKPPSDEEVE